MILNEADKQLMLTALDAYGRQLTQDGATNHIIEPVIDLLGRLAEADTEIAKHVEQLINLAEMAEAIGDDDEVDGIDFDENDDGEIVEIRWKDRELAIEFVNSLDYISAVMLYDLLDLRLEAYDPEIALVTEEANPVTRDELAKILYGGPINVTDGVRAKEHGFKSPKPSHMTLSEYLGTGTEDF